MDAWIALPTMIAEDRVLCLLAQEYDDKGRADLPSRLAVHAGVDWHWVFRMADAQGVSPLVHANLAALPELSHRLPHAALNGFKRAYVHNVLKKQGSQRALHQLAQLCVQHHVELLLVKGAALSLFVHQQPWSFISGDMDVVIRPAPSATAVANLGAVIDFMDRHNHRHDPMVEHFEYELYSHHDVSMNDVLRIPSQELWQDAGEREIHGCPVFVLSPEMMLIAACVNACRKRYFYLKSLNDIAAICRKFPSLNWRAIGARARTYRADTIVYTALWVTQQVLGVELPAAAWRHVQLAPLRRQGIQAMVALLCRYGSLEKLTAGHGALFGRQLNLSLLLTYMSYRGDVLGGKLGEILRAWRNPPPPKPVTY